MEFKEGLNKIHQEMKEKEIWIKEVAIAKQLIKEIKDPLDLLRELISNAAAREVQSTSITISLYSSPDGQVFEVSDNGIGMNSTDNKGNPGRLERFLSLGYSGTAGFKPDEFGWKGLGSKLAFRSKLVDVLTTSKEQKTQYHILIDEPWASIEDNRMPRPTFSDKKEETSKSGSKIKVSGYPLYKLADTRDMSFDSIKDFLLHRTFIGYTKERENPPKITLKTSEKSEEISVGFPVLREIKRINPSYNQSGYATFDDGRTVFVNKRVQKNLDGKSSGITIHLKGVYTTPELKERYGLSSNLAQGLILSVNGIPYCSLDMSNLFEGRLLRNPGPSNLCFICECDEISQDMNIGRNGYTASPLTQLFEHHLAKLLEEIDKSNEYNEFANIWRRDEEKESAEEITKTIEGLQKGKYGWVFLKEEGKNPLLLHRIPQNEQDVIAILLKLEGAGKLSSIFAGFCSLAATTWKGTDLIVNLHETPQDYKTYVSVEIKKVLNPKTLGHSPRQTPIIICWEIKSKMPLLKSDGKVPYKYTMLMGNKQLAVYVIKEMKDIIEIKEPNPLEGLPEL